MPNPAGIIQEALRQVKTLKDFLGEEMWHDLEKDLLTRHRPWHPAVFLPGDLSQEVLLLGFPNLRERIERRQYTQENLKDFAVLNLLSCSLAAMLPWNLTKGAYVFDGDLFDSLVDAPLERIPVELLTRLPEYAPLLIFPHPWMGWQGAWIYFDEDRYHQKAHLEFRILFLSEGGGRLPALLDLQADTLEGCLEATERETEFSKQITGLEVATEFTPNSEQMIRGMLNLALYLASEEPDLSARPRPLPGLSQRRKDRPPRVYPDPNPQRIEVGWRIGAALRRARQESHAATGTGRSPQPHIRRAHWHLYWTGEGSRKDPSKAQPKVRWIEPTLVGADRLEGELPAVVRPVKEEP